MAAHAKKLLILFALSFLGFFHTAVGAGFAGHDRRDPVAGLPRRLADPRQLGRAAADADGDGPGRRLGGRLAGAPDRHATPRCDGLKPGPTIPRSCTPPFPC